MRALLFPGQGSQRVGMGKALADAFPAARDTFAEADASLGFALSKLCWEGPEAELTLTAHAQPAILTTSIAALRAARSARAAGADGVAYAAGHSLGEWSALVAADALAFQDAVRLVHLRGRYMQEAVAPGAGAMAAIVGLDARTVEDTCLEAAQGEPVSPANFNGGGQIVISGAKAAVERAMALAKQKGAKLVKALAVSAPFHCALMQPAADRLAADLETVEVRVPRFPVVHNASGEENGDPSRVKSLLLRQITAPVRWEACGARLAALGVTEAWELGAGSVLAGLMKRIAPEMTIASVGDPAGVQAVTT